MKPIGPNICSAFLNIWTKLNKILAVSKILLSNTNVGKRLNVLFQFKINSSCSQNSTCRLIRCRSLYMHNMQLRYGLPIWLYPSFPSRGGTSMSLLLTVYFSGITNENVWKKNNKFWHKTVKNKCFSLQKQLIDVLSTSVVLFKSGPYIQCFFPLVRCTMYTPDVLQV